MVRLEIFAGQFPQTREEETLMRKIVNGMKSHFIHGAHEPKIRPPANKKELIKMQPEFNVIPQSKRVIFIEPKYQVGTYTPIKKEIETTVCKGCDTDTVNGDYCSERCKEIKHFKYQK